MTKTAYTSDAILIDLGLERNSLNLYRICVFWLLRNWNINEENAQIHLKIYINTTEPMEILSKKKV